MAAHHQDSTQVDHRLSRGANLHGHQPVSSDNESRPIKGTRSNSANLHEELKKYQYLDDYDYCRKERIKQNAMDKYNQIMQSIRSKSRDLFPYEIDEDARDNMVIYDIERSPGTSSTSSDTKLSHDFLTCYKKILRRHGKRLDTNRYA